MKYKSTKDFYVKFLQLFGMMQNWLYDVYLHETFCEGLHIKLKLEILALLRGTIIKVIT
jgi:hypothetical protein